jgi:hypothetical protein
MFWMFRIALTGCCGVILGSCTIASANKIDWEHARLACADVGISPGNSAFNQCVTNLYDSLWQAQSTGER